MKASVERAARSGLRCFEKGKGRRSRCACARRGKKSAQPGGGRVAAQARIDRELALSLCLPLSLPKRGREGEEREREGETERDSSGCMSVHPDTTETSIGYQRDAYWISLTPSARILLSVRVPSARGLFFRQKWPVVISVYRLFAATIGRPRIMPIIIVFRGFSLFLSI